MREWYVVHCQPHKEDQVAAYIDQVLGLAVYLPKVQQRQRGTIVMVPFFLRYLFVHVDLYHVPPSVLSALPGVVRLVGIDQRPQSIPDHIVEALHTRVEEINRTGQFITHSFRPGDTVRFTSGPFSGFDAVFDSSLRATDRVRVLLECMGQLNSVDVDATSLERVILPSPPPSPPPAPRQRRTRGKGRRIANDEHTINHE